MDLKRGGNSCLLKDQWRVICLDFFVFFPPNNRINYLQNKRKKILNAPENHLLQKKEFLY